MKAYLVLPLFLLLQACQTPQEHMGNVRAAQDGEKLTVGTVQRQIKVGMSSADVAGVLGSPNIVTTDDQRREQWVYDRVATETAYSTSSGGVSALILGGGAVGAGILGGAGGTGYDSSAGAVSSTQRTITIIVKFDKASRVRDFAYHTSSF